MRLKYILALLIGVGVVFSVWDYKKWRNEETRNFGQGSGTSRITNNELRITQVYQNDEWGVRIKYPEGWNVEQTVKFERTERNLPDIVDDEVVKIGKLDREPDHVDTNITILTWRGRQMAITKGGMTVVKIEGPDGGTVGEMAKSLVFF